MKRSSSLVLWAVVFLAMLVMASPPAHGQGGTVTTSLSGLVVDTSGGVMPGVDVVVKNNATGGASQTVTDGGGRFTVPALPPGTYTVTLSLTGFKTVVLPDIPLVAATPQSVKVTLELGKIEETVVVTGAAEIVQTQTAAVQTTIVVQQIQQLPLVTRTALDYVVNMPGVSTPNSGATRSSSLMGLPGYTNNITLDGVNVQSNDNKEGFFMYIRPLMDSVEEITVSTSTPGAESSGQGATQIRMVTRSGSNRFSGSVYNTWRNQAGTTAEDAITRTKTSKWIWRLNTPYWFNKRDIPKTAAGEDFINDVRLQTPGFRVGGPVLKDKLFYFFNWEWFLWPNQVTRNRWLLNPKAQQGLFTYTANDGTTRELNLLTMVAGKPGLAASSTLDPTVAKLLADIRSTTEQGIGGVSTYDLNVDMFTYSPEGEQYRHFPTLRLDYNVTQNHRLTFTSRFNRFKSSPDVLNSNEPLWPGFPNQAGQYSKRFMAQGTLRSTFTRNLVNEARIGYAGAFEGGTHFGEPWEVSESVFNCSGLGCQSVGGKGYSIGIGGAASDISGATRTTGPSRDYQPSRVFEDTLTWLKGKHSLSMGMSFTNIRTIEWADTVVPSITLSLSSLDPAYTHLTYTSGNYPGGISSTQAGYAQDLYGVLTGRVTTISGTAYLDANTGKYVYLGERLALASMNELGLFVSDSWRLRPNLTINGGLRYELQFPFKPDNSSYSRPQDWRMVYGLTGAGSGELGQGNLFQPGTLTGTAPLLENYTKGSSAYKTDINNVAPSIGAAWRPNLKAPFLTWLLSTDPVIRGGYSISYSRVGTDWFTGIYGDNPGRSRTATRSTTTGCNGACYIGYDGFPVLLRETNRLWPGTFPDAPTYPFSPAVNESIHEYHPDTRVPSTRQWSLGWQRELGKSMAVEVRYVGNSNRGSIESYNINSSSNWNIIENGFYDEFRKAQVNLQANIAAGRCQPGVTSSGCQNNFAYYGPGTGTAPLPVFQAYFAGTPLNDTANNQNPAKYTSSNYRSSSWYNSLRMYSPALTTIAGTGTSGIQNTAYAANAGAAGLPANFFMANPSIAQANSELEANGGNTKYHALQLELRRRMSQGLLVQGSYHLVLSRSSWNYNSMREDWFYYNSGPSSHAIKFNWVFELPFGRGKPFGGGVSRWMDMLIGGWEFDGVGRIQSGSIFNYGGYRLVGMTEKDLQNMFKFYKREDADGKTQLYMFPQDVIDNSILALYTASATSPTGYSGALPTGRYLAPASGPDCVSFIVRRNDIRCPGTAETRYIKGPWYWKIDMSFVKRVAVVRNMRIEARMDLYNIFNTINFNATSGMGSSVSNWRVTSAATDFSASQDPGGRITSFGLRFTW